MDIFGNCFRIHLLKWCLCINIRWVSCCIHTVTVTNTPSHRHPLSLSHTHTYMPSHTHTYTPSHTHTYALIHTHTHTYAPSYTQELDYLMYQWDETVHRLDAALEVYNRTGTPLICVYMCVCVYVCMCICGGGFGCVGICVCLYVYMQVYIYILYMYVHIHKSARSSHMPQASVARWVWVPLTTCSLVDVYHGGDLGFAFAAASTYCVGGCSTSTCVGVVWVGVVWVAAQHVCGWVLGVGCCDATSTHGHPHTPTSPPTETPSHRNPPNS